MHSELVRWLAGDFAERTASLARLRLSLPSTANLQIHSDCLYANSGKGRNRHAEGGERGLQGDYVSHLNPSSSILKACISASS